MGKNGHVGPYIHTHQDVYFIQKEVNLQFVLITNDPKLSLLPRFLQKYITRPYMAISSSLRPWMRPIPR